MGESGESKQRGFATDGAPMNTDDRRFDWITETIIGCAYKVASKLGFGFLEQCYENALAYELRNRGLRVQQQARLQVWYDNIVVGEYVADLIVEDVVLVELKAISGLEAIHSAICINYLAATKLPLCLLINFGRRVDVPDALDRQKRNRAANRCEMTGKNELIGVHPWPIGGKNVGKKAKTI